MNIQQTNNENNNSTIDTIRNSFKNKGKYLKPLIGTTIAGLGAGLLNHFSDNSLLDTGAELASTASDNISNFSKDFGNSMNGLASATSDKLSTIGHKISDTMNNPDNPLMAYATRIGNRYQNMLDVSKGYLNNDLNIVNDPNKENTTRVLVHGQDWGLEKNPIDWSK